jgi:hypothetical protein
MAHKARLSFDTRTSLQFPFEEMSHQRDTYSALFRCMRIGGGAY